MTQDDSRDQSTVDGTSGTDDARTHGTGARGPGEAATSRLEEAILGERPTLTGAEVAEQAGVDPDQARRMWRALGFPELEGGEDDGSRGTPGVVGFTTADVEAVRDLYATAGHGLIDVDTAVTLARAVGQTMSRLADWEVATLVTRIEQIEAQGRARAGASGSQEPRPGRADLALKLVEDIGTGFESLLVYTWRRHLAAAVARLEALSAAEEDLHTANLTVGFADIVSFTALSNRLEHDRIGDLVELFELRCHDVVSAHRGRVIKSIGDSVLFLNDDAGRAMRTAEGIIQVIGRDRKMPDVRVGLASGAVTLRLGDVFGPPVNMAARLTAVARRNRVIVDSATADLLPPHYETRRLPARPVRGFGLVEPVAVRRA
ncbi:adenylate/guanylate cyclase domain-containing protein [uncultured Nocardioides sp.]|uniref:adenylate/guanylate cyclase domain-containing protein n=1 Tax=uncultured Nocardioides sp. TaxID=198441 RepID=UPI002619FE99|nr:adenylate/guanylate cyclase domain-containing protein [uncultured Nocardioides sp.]